MYHAHPPRECWCGKTHTPCEAFDLNVYGRDDLPPDKYDADAAAGAADLAEALAADDPGEPPDSTE